jgi:hypothetical protein
LLTIGHAANPRRQLGWHDCQPSSRLALAFEASRISVNSCFPTAAVAPTTNTRINRAP